MVGDYSEVKGSLVEESTIHVILCLEQALLHEQLATDKHHWGNRRADGISTATSMTHGSSSVRLTATLLIQLPTTAIFAGLSNATFQLASSVGTGRG